MASKKPNKLTAKEYADLKVLIAKYFLQEHTAYMAVPGTLHDKKFQNTIDYYEGLIALENYFEYAHTLTKKYRENIGADLELLKKIQINKFEKLLDEGK